MPENANIKQKIIKWVSSIEQFKKKNQTCKTLLKKIMETGDKIALVYGKIHNEEYGSQEELDTLMMEISQISQEKRDAEKEYKIIMEKEFGDFKKEYENIYELAISEEGIDRQTLNHVLDVFDKFQRHEINSNEGVNQGLDFMKKKFNLPDDFLNHLPE